MLALLSRLNDRLADKAALPGREERAVVAPRTPMGARDALYVLASFVLLLEAVGLSTSSQVL